MLKKWRVSLSYEHIPLSNPTFTILILSVLAFTKIALKNHLIHVMWFRSTLLC